jgi:hypothetical protein
MIELAFVILLNRVVNWGLAPIIVTRTVPADADALHDLLAEPANQWRLATAVADVEGLRSAGDRCDAHVRIPLRIRRPASMLVHPSRTHRLLTTEVRLGRSTIAWATWILTPGRGTTEVDLAVQPESRSLLTRLALLLGGRRWLARRLQIALATLATASAHVAEDIVATPAGRVMATPPSSLGDPPQRPAPAIRH